MTGTAFSVWPASSRDHPAAPPRPVRVAFAALAVALAAGIAEAVVRAALAFPETDRTTIAAGLAVRTAIYLLVLVVAVRMTRGDRWARLLIAVGIGVFGLLSLIVEPLAAAMSANELRDLFRDASPASVPLASLRSVHVIAVLIAVPALYTRPARRYFRKR
ncbi:hypothetical protein IU486_10475 [Streptomyces gardneri]|uniref:hypothetical protein n=1 Tax=Nocardia TaxID=1817 RepID=UPI00135C3501|nr:MULTISPECIES: hypothetical protein [Nocardia]MBF6165198.1 hypothetical protein [Streptomyces gardneri]MBF6208118.1 hypothetical protein [Streptomyces gardneri]